MPDFSILESVRAANAGAVPASSTGTQVTASATPLAKGNWTQLIASTPIHASTIWVTIMATDTNDAHNIDIGIGGVGAEVVLIPDLFCMIENSANHFRTGWYQFPISIPAGSRLSARSAAQNPSAVCRVNTMLYGGGFLSPSPLSTVTAYGLNPADLQGVQVDPGGSLNTKGAWTEIVASTSRMHRGFILVLGPGNNNARSDNRYLIDLAIGGSGAEAIILPDMQASSAAAEDLIIPQVVPFIPFDIPALSRLAVRAQTDTTNATNRVLDVALYGVS